MGTISVNWEVNVYSGHENIELEDMNCESIDEWNDLSKDQQNIRIQEYLDDLDRVCIVVDNFEPNLDQL